MQTNGQNKENSKLTNDLLLILILLCLSLSVFLVVELSRKPGETVRVSVNGEWVAEYSLNRDGEYVLNGGTNVLVISEGRAYMKYADCPDGFCKRQGAVSKTRKRITCLPNRVVVEVTGEKSSDFIDRN